MVISMIPKKTNCIKKGNHAIWNEVEDLGNTVVELVLQSVILHVRHQCTTLQCYETNSGNQTYMYFHM